MIKQWVSYSAEETQGIAQIVWQNHQQYSMWSLNGELGSGKTTFIQGLGETLQISRPINSPTYLIMKIYPIPNHPHYKNLIHVDLYRISSTQDAIEIGLTDLWSDPNNLVLIEWASRIQSRLPEKRLELDFSRGSNDQRTIKLTKLPTQTQV